MEYSLNAGTPSPGFGSPFSTGTAAPTADRAASLQPFRYGAMTAHVVAFLAQLRHTPLDAWLHAAETDGHHRALADADTAVPAARLSAADGRDADRRARARLRELMDTMPHVVRRIRASIDDSLTIIDGMASPASVARMRRAARLAACSIAAQRSLTADEFARLYRPFTALIPFYPRGE